MDAITPYGYGGPVGGDVREFWRAYDAWCREQGVVTTFVRFHPLYANARDAPIHVEALAPTIAWRLGEEDLEAGMHLNHRRAVRKARNAGVTVTAADGVGDFVPLYEETMRRANAAPFYFFAAEYWQSLERAQLVRFDAQLGDETVASALCLGSPPWLHYHLGATSDEGRRLGAMTLLFLEAATWARERGYERFHLGGGVGGSGGLAARVQAPLRSGRPGRCSGRKGRARRGSVREPRRSPDDCPWTATSRARPVGARRKTRRVQADIFALGGTVPRPRPGTVPPKGRCAGGYGSAMIVVEILFWASLAGILWTHAGYPVAAALLASVHTRKVRKADVTPSVTVIIPAHDEEDVIAARLDNLLALDYPHEQLEIIVASDASTDGTDAIVTDYAARDPRIRLLALPSRRQARRAQPRRDRERPRGRRVLRRELELGAGCAAQARRQPRRPRGRVRLRQAQARARRRHEPRGHLLALRALAARERVAARLDHGRQRLDLRRAPRPSTSRTASASTSAFRTRW